MLNKSTNENLEKTYDELRKSYIKSARAKGGKAYFEVVEDTLNAMEGITKERLGRKGGSGFWRRNVYEDLGENIGALGELAAIFGPSAIDVLRDLEKGSTGVKLDEDAGLGQQAAGVVSVWSRPRRETSRRNGWWYGPYFNEPPALTESATNHSPSQRFLPMYRMLQAAGSSSAGKMISILNKAADAEGIDLKSLPELKFSEKDTSADYPPNA